MIVAFPPIQTSLPITVSPREGRPVDQIDVCGPRASHDREREGGDATHSMVGTVHDERGPGGEGAELTDDQPVGTVVVQNVSGFELVRELGVVVVAELPNLDQRAGDQGLEKHY